ncbi:hypothetical protein O6H91_15G038400 [Diphasiastrum complanatum]|uniref:Uncharacterized protein n=1 Tax=Diphasiastrum complanatum TaxID=34168 RepID=A0ACC2BHJ6_DIPCM|nr:hypothetical protein O6H91_15G038400 [Diphasiastrum complanatum]
MHKLLLLLLLLCPQCWRWGHWHSSATASIANSQLAELQSAQKKRFHSLTQSAIIRRREEESKIYQLILGFRGLLLSFLQGCCRLTGRWPV